MNSKNNTGVLKKSKAAPGTPVKERVIETDVLIIGGGISGAFAAVNARKQGADVTVVDKGTAGKAGLTPFFHGFAYCDESEGASREEWSEAFKKAKEWISRQDYVDLFLDDSKARWDDLDAWGAMAVDKEKHGPKLRRQIQKAGARLIERVMIVELTKKGNTIAGAIGFHMEGDKAIIFKAGAVVICAGAGTFKTPGWMASNTFDAHIMAYEVGAEISGKEWNDPHPTTPINPADIGVSKGDDLIRPLQKEIYPLFHGIHQNITKAHSGDLPIMDVPPPNSPGNPNPFPPRPSRAIVLGATAGMAEHRTDGIFPKDNQCWSGVPGLYAAGDAMCTGGVGLGGSSTPGCAVQGVRAGINAADYAMNNKRKELSKVETDKVINRIFTPRFQEKGYSPAWVTQALQGIMVPYYVLYVKEKRRLEAALANIEFLRDHFGPKLIANDSHELRQAHETRNMILNAEMKLRASLMREESRDTHYREEFPYRDDDNWLAWIIIKKEGDGMKLTKRDIPEEWKPDLTVPYEERYPNRYPGELEALERRAQSAK